jgi:RimJ/RimL family protein N-acetyltransferase
MASIAEPALFVDVSVNGRAVGLRPMTPDDVEPFVSYWHDGGADLGYLGIDPVKLGTATDTRQRFDILVHGPRPRQALGFTITLDGRAVGFINVNVLGRERGRAHFHLVDPAARRGGVMSAVLEAGLPEIMERMRTESGADGLLVEIRTRNVGMNRVLQALGHQVVDTQYLPNPDGLAGPGTFHTYEID